MAAERRAGAGPLAIVLTARGVEPDVWLEVAPFERACAGPDGTGAARLAA